MISIYGYATGSVLQSPRVLFSMAERGELPRCFARVHPRFRTPARRDRDLRACWRSALALYGSFEWNATLSAIVRLVTYGLTCAALLVLRARRPDEAPGFRLPRRAPVVAPAGAGFLPVAAVHAHLHARPGSWLALILAVGRACCGGLAVAAHNRGRGHEHPDLPRGRGRGRRASCKEQGGLGAILVDLEPLARIERSFGGATYQALRAADRPADGRDEGAVARGRHPDPRRARGRPLLCSALGGRRDEGGPSRSTDLRKLAERVEEFLTPRVGAPDAALPARAAGARRRLRRSCSTARWRAPSARSCA